MQYSKFNCFVDFQIITGFKSIGWTNLFCRQPFIVSDAYVHREKNILTEVLRTINLLFFANILRRLTMFFLTSKSHTKFF